MRQVNTSELLAIIGDKEVQLYLLREEVDKLKSELAKKSESGTTE